jgi:hypothetical protein
MAKNSGQDVSIEINDLSRHHFKARSFENNVPVVRTVICDPSVQERGDEAKATKFIKASLERWGTSRKDLEAKVLKFLKELHQLLFLIVSKTSTNTTMKRITPPTNEMCIPIMAPQADMSII